MLRGVSSNLLETDRMVERSSDWFDDDDCLFGEGGVVVPRTMLASIETSCGGAGEGKDR